jgi:hypothetical protein
MPEISKLVSAAWAQLNDADKQPFVNQAKVCAQE